MPPITIPASGDLSSNQYYFVKVNTSGQVAVCLDGERPDGILLNKPAAAGRAASIAESGEQTHAICGAAVTRGSELAADATGRAVAAASGDEVGAVALESGTGAGSIIRVIGKFTGGVAS